MAHRPLKVAHVVDLLGTGGAERLVVLLAGALRRRGAEVTVIALGPSAGSPLAAELEAAGAGLTSMPPRGPRGLLDVRRVVRLASYLRAERFDVVQTHLAFGNTLGTLAAWLARAPSLATMHSTAREPRRASAAKEALETFVVRRLAAGVVAVGPTVAAAHDGKARPGRMVVLPNPVGPPVQLAPGERARLRVELTGDASRPLVVAAGRLSAEKGHADLVAAFDHARRRVPAAFLAVAGTGSLRADLDRRIDDAGLEGSVALLGWRDDVPRILAAADAFASASHWEGMPLAVVEAMGAGLPVVATAVGDVAALLDDGRGVAVPAGDVEALGAALASVLADAGLAKRLGEAARAHTRRHHALDEVCDRLLDLYGTLVS